MTLKKRPTRTNLVRLLQKTGGNLTQLAGLLNVSRPTLYKWVSQLGLEPEAGIEPDPYRVSDTGISVNLPAPESSIVPPVSSTEAVDPIIQTTLRIRQSLWKRVRKTAIDRDCLAMDLLEKAISGYLDQAEASLKPKGKAKA